MTITLSLAKWLQANPVITALTTEIKPMVLEDDHADPALTYQLIHDERTRTIDAFSSINTAEFQIDCYSHTYSKARDLAAAVRSELEPYSGTFADHIAQQVDFNTERDMHEAQTRLHRVMLTFSLWYNEAAP